MARIRVSSSGTLAAPRVCVGRLHHSEGWGRKDALVTATVLRVSPLRERMKAYSALRSSRIPEQEHLDFREKQFAAQEALHAETDGETLSQQGRNARLGRFRAAMTNPLIAAGKLTTKQAEMIARDLARVEGGYIQFGEIAPGKTFAEVADGDGPANEPSDKELSNSLADDAKLRNADMLSGIIEAGSDAEYEVLALDAMQAAILKGYKHRANRFRDALREYLPPDFPVLAYPPDALTLRRMAYLLLINYADIVRATKSIQRNETPPRLPHAECARPIRGCEIDAALEQRIVITYGVVPAIKSVGVAFGKSDNVIREIKTRYGVGSIAHGGYREGSGAKRIAA